MADVIDLISGTNLEEKAYTAEVNEEIDFSSYIIESSRDGMLAYDLGFRYTIWNKAMFDLTGRTREEVIGRTPFEVFGHMNRPEARTLLENAVKGIPGTLVHNFYHAKKQILLTVESIHTPLKNEFGEIVGGLAIIRDKTELKQAYDKIQVLNQDLESQLKEQTQSLQFLSDASVVLGSCSDLNTILQNFSYLIVRQFSGWCMIRLIEGDGTYLTVFGDTNEERKKHHQEMDHLYPTMNLKVGPKATLDTLQPLWIVRLEESHLQAPAYDQKHFEMMLKYNPVSFMSLPLISAGRVLGVISVVNSVRSYSRFDFESAKLIANLCAMTIDNMQLKRTGAQKP